MYIQNTIKLFSTKLQCTLYTEPVLSIDSGRVVHVLQVTIVWPPDVSRMNYLSIERTGSGLSVNALVYFSTYANLLYSASDLRQIRYSAHPTYQHVVLQLLYRLVAAAAVPLACQLAAALSPLACPSRSARPRNCLNLI